MAEGAPADVRAILRCKVAVCGAPGVGKTALVSMLASQGKTFPKKYQLTAGVEVTQCRAPLSEGPVSVELFLLDTSGDTAFWDIVPKYWNGVTNALLVCDATDEASLDECEKWRALLMQLRRHKAEPLRLAMVANKVDKVQDCDRVVAKAQQWAAENDMPFFEVSAVPPGQDYEAPFAHVATEYCRYYLESVEKLEKDSTATAS